MTPFGAQVGPMSGKRDYYDVLGISKDASEDQIKQSFRSLARKYHPDKHQQCKTGMTDEEATNFFQKANNAQELLIAHFRDAQ